MATKTFKQSHGSPATTSHLKIPAKLRASSIASFLEQFSSSSCGSSPGGVSASLWVCGNRLLYRHLLSRRKVLLNHQLGMVTCKASRGRPQALGTGPTKRPSPPRPQAIHVPNYGSIGKPLFLDCRFSNLMLAVDISYRPCQWDRVIHGQIPTDQSLFIHILLHVFC